MTRLGLPHFVKDIYFGAVAQLEERHNGIVEVVGSIPIGSTILSMICNGHSFFTSLCLVLLVSCGEPTLEDQVLRALRDRIDTNNSELILIDKQIEISQDGLEFKKINPDSGFTDAVGLNHLGQITYKGSFMKDQPHGFWTTFYDNGRPRWSGSKKVGQSHGKYYMWYENGRKKTVGSFSEGRKNGSETSWFANGVKWQERFYENGLPTGLWKTWNEQGFLASSRDYRPSIALELSTKSQ